MDLGELHQSFRTRVRDEVEPYLWTDQFVTDALNEAEREACVRSRLIFDDSTTDVCEISVTSGTGRYSPHKSVDVVETAYVTDAYGITYSLEIIDQVTLVRRYPRWHDESSGVPAYLIHNEKTITLFPTPDADYTLSIGVFRLPIADMEVTVDEPEINEVHHNGLIDWVEFRAFSIPDVDTYDQKKSERAEAAFIRRFGIRVDANVRRKHRENRAHVVRPIEF